MLDQRRERVVGPVDEEARDDGVGGIAAPRDESAAAGWREPTAARGRRRPEHVRQAATDRQSLPLIAVEGAGRQDAVVDWQRWDERWDDDADDQQYRQRHGHPAHADPEAPPLASAPTVGIQENGIAACGCDHVSRKSAPYLADYCGANRCRSTVRATRASPYPLPDGHVSGGAGCRCLSPRSILPPECAVRLWLMAGSAGIPSLLSAVLLSWARQRPRGIERLAATSKVNSIERPSRRRLRSSGPSARRDPPDECAELAQLERLLKHGAVRALHEVRSVGRDRVAGGDDQACNQLWSIDA